jgi:hypothetical protein
MSRLQRALRVASVFVLASIAATAAQPASVGGVEFTRYLHTREGVLELASCGVRNTLWMEHYVAALYVPRGGSARAVQDREQPKAVVMQVVDGRFIPQRIPRKWRRPLGRTLDAATFSRVQRAFRTLSEGDRITVLYTPRSGLSMYLNDRLVAQDEGHTVIDAILDAWKENDTIQGKLDRLQSEHPCD